MASSKKAVMLSPRKVSEIERKLADLRHDVNNNLTLIVAAAEIIRHRPEQAEQFWESLMQKPMKVADQVSQFSRDLEKALRIGPP